MATDSTASKQFEFSADQNKMFQSAGYWMGIMGRLGVLFGVLGCVLFGLSFNIPGLASGVIAIICGVWNVRAAAAFRKVDESTGNDVANVMVAVDNLASLYRLQAILIGIAAAVFIVSVVLLVANEFILQRS